MNSVSAAGGSYIEPKASTLADRELTRASVDSKRLTETEQKSSTLEEVNPSRLQEAVDVMNQAVQLDKRGLSFAIDDVSGRSIIKVTDLSTDELIRQIPAEEILKVAQDIKQLQEKMGQSIGLLIDKRV